MITITHPTSGKMPRRGQAVVEFALILPLFVLLVFGALELGRAMLRVHLLNNAVREGARVGTLPGSLEQDVANKVSSFLQLQGMAAGTWTTTVTVTAPDGTARAGGLASALQGDLVKVTLTNQFNVLTGSIIPGFLGTKTLTANCVFRHE
jgi:Flp pilus assembly protein TadG